jgi:hypothetical protein
LDIDNIDAADEDDEGGFVIDMGGIGEFDFLWVADIGYWNCVISPVFIVWLIGFDDCGETRATCSLFVLGNDAVQLSSKAVLFLCNMICRDILICSPWFVVLLQSLHLHFNPHVIEEAKHPQYNFKQLTHSKK